MGCDGGTIPRRDELVRLKKKPEQKDKASELQFRWMHCSLTQQPLQEPIVMCGLGRLYSKQNVIEQLLEKDKMPESAMHIKSLKDIKTLNLTPNPAFQAGADKSEGLLDVRSAPYICKLIGLEMTGKFRFVALWTCGCVFSERALKEVKTNICSLCQTPFSEQDVIILNGSDEDVNFMAVKLESRIANRKANKKSKKQESKIVTECCTVTCSEDNSEKKSSNKPETTDDKVLFAKPELQTINIVAASSSSSKIVPIVDEPQKISKIIGSKIAKPLKRSLGDKPGMDDPAFKKSKDAYSVARDPKATDVYKSLFTSHKSEQSQNRAHWVTYNPFYN